MGLDVEALDEFHQYFCIPCMAYCGGSGASFIGDQRRNTASYDPEENVLMAIPSWVEEGVAPDTFTGTLYR